ncbi:MAG: ribonuclease P protein component [Candidatus Margulisbacteria bacterium]|nr:ribonuclease P protein component [Candidatus Margulisiibacteriota bacterium]MBU1021983.1 ribonuclease P protein component [Candidatus Margulisiibacteriota bacterium]MBU1728961.1 ribonuclease P protein component [Candidatus Margulisiibacteriota bacterium]MBU1954767.1 ribonuclease P protein component [Candidatus Margulisiibacteriota bacterium]
MKTLKREKDFDRVYKYGKTARCPFGRIHYIANDLGELRIAVATPRKLGGAVTRNRIRRRIREAIRSLSPAKAGLDVVVFPYITAKSEDFVVLKETIRKSLNNIGFLFL